MTQRYSIDYLDLFLPLIREQIPRWNPAYADVHVCSRLPDYLDRFLPVVQVTRTAGRTQYPRFTDRPWIRTQVWCDDPDDPYRAASNLIDAVRGAYFTAWDEQIVVPGVGHIIDVRESSGPEEMSDPDLPHIGRYFMLHEIRIRHDIS